MRTKEEIQADKKALDTKWDNGEIKSAAEYRSELEKLNAEEADLEKAALRENRTKEAGARFNQRAQAVSEKSAAKIKEVLGTKARRGDGRVFLEQFYKTLGDQAKAAAGPSASDEAIAAKFNELFYSDDEIAKTMDKVISEDEEFSAIAKSNKKPSKKVPSKKEDKEAVKEAGVDDEDSETALDEGAVSKEEAELVRRIANGEGGLEGDAGDDQKWGEVAELSKRLGDTTAPPPTVPDNDESSTS